MTLRIISPADIVFEGEVENVTLPGALGSFEVLPRHAALISTLVKGDISYTASGERHTVSTDGGLVDVLNDVVSVCIY
ncbi:MAG: F0F1 ATP synthase subunit epsilon [Bacteroides sp.]|nr:F0F1 ATP synthase subunit epsilon [Bacteroides sp.]MCM1378804.1 F0F1 ATP synthase subunit epsilon [Bacteroides sp.]MCM1445421.1 F0F1 ATP synthase subunit epsilon [Prevotella sp.]